jgi:uncharacterized damage-inducible protein DinB
MLRHVGGPVPKPGLDYIFYRLEKNTLPAPQFEMQMIRDYEDFSDWGTRRLLDIAERLNDAQMDRQFEMGLGTVRKTFRHLAVAEAWWHQNWTMGPAGAFPDTETAEPLVEIENRLESAWVARDQFVSTLSEADLLQPVTVKPKPDLTLQFPIGVSLVQLCGHATHHRAQILNMFRHIGVEVPAMDLIIWLRDKAA